MTVAVEQMKVMYTGNGVTTNWPVPFSVLDADDVQVYLYEISSNTVGEALNPVLYQVNEVGEDDGSIDYPLSGDPLESTHSIIICRYVDILQPLNLNTASGFDPAALTAQLDLTTMAIQQVAFDVSRALKVNISETDDPDQNIDDLIAAAEIAADTVAALPGLSADTMLITNAGGTARENKTFAQTRAALNVADGADVTATALVTPTNGTAAATVATHIGRRLYAQDFGAVGDGTTDDTAALSAAFNSGRPITLVGKFRITSNIAVALAAAGALGLAVHGYGRALSQILLDAANVGISVTIDDIDVPWGPDSKSVDLQDFAIIPKSTSTGAAWKITGQPSTGSSEKTFFISNVDVVPDTTAHYTTIGFEFFDCRNSMIVDCVIDGDHGAYTGTGVKWWGGTASAPVGLKVIDCEINWWSKGLELAPNSGGTTSGGNDWQGVHVTDCTFLACEYGIHATSLDNFSEWLTVKGNHFNCRTAGVWCPDVGHVHITGNYFLFLGTAPGGTSYAVYTLINNFSGYKTQMGNISGNGVNFGANASTNRVGIYARTGGTNMWTTIRDNKVVLGTLEIDSSPSNFVFPGNPVSAVATTSGTAFDFSFPGGVRRIKVEFLDVSLSGTDNYLVQLGDSGGIETTGYGGTAGFMSNGANPITSAYTTGFQITGALATRTCTGIMMLENIYGTNVWIASFNGHEATGDAVVLTSNGSKTLSDVLTTVRITRSGTDTFDAGSVRAVAIG